MDADIACVSESFLTERDSKVYNMAGFHHVSLVRMHRGGGGVSIFVRNSLVVAETTAYATEDESVQLLVCRIERRSTACYVAAFYSNHRNIYSELLKLIESSISSLELPVFLAGDSNINTLSCDHISSEYLSLMASLGFLPVIGGVTRPESGTCLDHIFVPAGNPLTEVYSRIIECDVLSDHYPVWVAVCFGNCLPPPIPKPVTRRIFSSNNFQKYFAKLAAADMSAVYSSPDINLSVAALDAIIFKAYDSSFPLIKFYPAKLSFDTSFPIELRRLRRSLDRLRLKYCRNKNNLLAKHLYYSALRHYRTERRKLFTEKVRQNSKNQNASKTWRFVKRLLYGGESPEKPVQIYHEDSLVTGEAAVSEVFAKHFSNVASKTIINIDNSERRPISSFLPYQPLYLPFKFTPISRCTLLKKAASIRANFRQPTHSVPSAILKQALPLLSAPILHIFNTSLSSGIFPDSFKLTTTVPIYKGKGSKLDPGCYRPITLCSYLSKLLESCASSQLYTFLDKIKFFSKSQFGFLKGRSTEQALCELYNFVTHGSQYGNATVCTSLDVAKAFDCVSPDVFDELICCLGFDILSRQWLRSFLTGRHLSVCIKGHISSSYPLRLGVPQGSALGPLLFILYVNVLLDRLNSLPHIKSICYADDLVIGARIGKKSVSSDIRALEEALMEAKLIYDSLGLVLNVSKTEAVLFKDPRAYIQVPNNGIQINSIVIPFTDKMRCLGVQLSSDFSWGGHFRCLRGKCYSVIAALARLRRAGVEIEALILFYKALFVPVISYGISVWGGAHASRFHGLQVVQRDAIRSIFGLPRRSSVASLMNRHELMTLDQLFLFRVACIMYNQMVDHKSPSLLATHELRPRPPYPLRNYHETDVVRRTERTDYCARAPQYQQARIWNALPGNLRESKTLRAFRTKLGKTMFNA